jgi:hypothetical protein
MFILLPFPWHSFVSVQIIYLYIVGYLGNHNNRPLMYNSFLHFTYFLSEYDRIGLLLHVNLQNREVLTTSGTYLWSFVTQIFHNGQPSHGGDRKTFEVMA